MIGKGQRYQASPSHPALNATENEAVLQLAGGWRSREGHRVVSIRASQGCEPASRVKHRRLGVSFYEFRPPRVVYWIKLIAKQEVHAATTIGSELLSLAGPATAYFGTLPLPA